MNNDTRQTSGLATASLVLGILSPLCCSVFTGIPAVVCGHIARGKIKQDPSLKGDGLALAGLILGYISIALTIILMIVSAPLARQIEEFVDNAVAIESAKPLQVALQKMDAYPADSGIVTVTQLKDQLIKGEFLTAEEIEELDLARFEIGNVSKSDPSGTILVRTKHAPFGLVFFLPKEGEMQGEPTAEAQSSVPPRQPSFLSEE